MKFEQADVVVVGGGIVGVSAAYFLRKLGFDVVLVEQRELAFGASGRNAGFLWVQGRNAGVALEMSLMGRRMYDDFAAELGPNFEYRHRGGMIYFYTDAQRQVFQEFVELRRRDGLKMELLDAKSTREAAPILPESVLGATFCPEDGQIRTPRFVQALGAACQRLGVRIYENTAALGLMQQGEKVVGVRTVHGDVDAAAVVWAGGVWSQVLGDAAGMSIPVGVERLGVLQTAPVPARLDKVIYGPLAAKQYDMIRSLPAYREADFASHWEGGPTGVEHLELMAQTESGALLLGCPMDYPNDLDSRPTMRGLQLTMNSFLDQWPEYGGIGVERVWAGLLPYTADSLPIIDQVRERPGLYVACGHVYGNVAGPITGKLVSELVAGSATSLPTDAFSLYRSGLRGERGVVRW